MTIAADFTASARYGVDALSVIFTDASVGTVSRRKWITGDGSVLDTVDTQIAYTYRTPGIYSPILVVRNSYEQASVVKTDYIKINRTLPRSDFVIMKSFSAELSKYWMLYFDLDGYLYFETESQIRKSMRPLFTLRKWMFIEVHTGDPKIYFATGKTFRYEAEMVISINPSPLTEYETGTYLCPNSSMKIDELKIWSKEIDLKNYYATTSFTANFLDSTT